MKKDKFFFLVHEATEFCLAHANKCFGKWSREKIFLYIAQNALEGYLFIVKVENKVRALAVAKPTGEGRLFIGEVIGSRSDCRKMFSIVKKKWPNLKRFFAYRHCGQPSPKIVEFRPETIWRFCGNERSSV